jgi:hypothetical protein
MKNKVEQGGNGNITRRTFRSTERLKARVITVHPETESSTCRQLNCFFYLEPPVCTFEFFEDHGRIALTVVVTRITIAPRE